MKLKAGETISFALGTSSSQLVIKETAEENYKHNPVVTIVTEKGTVTLSFYESFDLYHGLHIYFNELI